MDTLRGNLGSFADGGYDPSDDEVGGESLPTAIGQDERRMQVRAYNHWAGLLADRNFPAIEDLEPANLPDFGPYSVLLDFTNGIEDPGIVYIGEKLASECGANSTELSTLSDVPSRSLLSRITDHYMQILANQAPIGFEAEFVNQRGRTTLYRGILLPFSSDDDTIDFIYGVINWKELADQQAADELLLEIDQALESKAPRSPLLEPLTDWADGPGSATVDDAPDPAREEDVDDALPRPSFGVLDNAPEDDDEPFELDDSYETDEEDTGGFASLIPSEPELLGATPRKKPIVLDDSAHYDLPDPFELEDEIVLPELAPEAMGLADWLVAAREMAAAARSSEDRTRNALYDAISRAFDFSLAAAQAPDEFAELLADAGLTLQKRAPMTPVVKLVFGADYDKTRLTEYASALTHAHRLHLPQGALGDFLSHADGGLKGVVQAERRMRREEAGKPVDAPDAPRRALAKKLRALPPQDFAAIAPDGQEFALVMIRRTEEGTVVILGEVPDDLALIEKAGRRLTA